MIDAAAIRRRREKLGLSLADAAIAAGWGEPARKRWHDIEAGRRANVSIEVLDAMAKALRCSVKSLVRDSTA